MLNLVVAVAFIGAVIVFAILCCCCRRVLCNGCEDDSGFHKCTQIKCNEVFDGNFNKNLLDEETGKLHYTATNGNVTKSPIQDNSGKTTPAFYFQTEYKDTQRSLFTESTHRQRQFKKLRSADNCNNLYSNEIHLTLCNEIKDNLPDVSKSLPVYIGNRFKANQYPYICYYCARTFKQVNDVNNHRRHNNNGGCRVNAGTKIDPSFKETTSILSKKARLRTDEYEQAKVIVSYVLGCILKSSKNNKRFSKFANREGSTLVGLKTGKPTEFDYSVSLNLCKTPEIGWQAPLSWKYTTDNDGKQKGRRSFGEDSIETVDIDNPSPIPEGCVIVKLHPSDANKFRKSCRRGIFPARDLLRSFHDFIYQQAHGKCIKRANIEVYRSTSGPAVTFKIEHPDLSNFISVDLTPKIDIPFHVVESIIAQSTDIRKWLPNWNPTDNIYLVPKCEKYWKISIANFENDVLHVLCNHSVEKQCIRIMKYRLNNWRATTSGLNCISSYLVKNVFFWLRERIPNDDDWTEEHLADKYVNFLQELLYACETCDLKEYFNHNCNLLAGKKEESLDKLTQLLKKEISTACSLA